jgi:hypothetical protein
MCNHPLCAASPSPHDDVHDDVHDDDDDDDDDG